MSCVIISNFRILKWFVVLRSNVAVDGDAVAVKSAVVQPVIDPWLQLELLHVRAPETLFRIPPSLDRSLFRLGVIL